MKTTYIIGHDLIVDMNELRRATGWVLANYIEEKIGSDRLVGLAWHEKTGEFGWILEHEAA